MNLLEAMRYLAALEQHRHFSRAAQACHITQPALSNAVRALEAEFGVTIVRRSRQYEGLTAEGEKVLATAHRMLHERETLRQELHALAEAPRGPISIASVPTASPIAARFAARLQARHPGIVPAVRSLSSGEIESRIENLSLDIAFGYGDHLGARASAVSVLPQYTEHYFLLRRKQGRADTRRRIGEPISWRDAAALPLCMLTPEMHNRTIVDASFAMAGASARVAMETNSVLTLVLSVLAGEMSSVMPGALVALALQQTELEALPLIEPQVLTAIGLLVSSNGRRSFVQAAALDFANEPEWVETLAEYSGPLDR